MNPDALPDMTAKRAELTPDRVAFTEHASGQHLTFAEVDDAAARIATGFRTAGLAPGDRLAVLSLNRIDFFLALFTCQKAELVMAPLNWRQPASELDSVSEAFAPNAILYDDANRDTARALAKMRGLTTLAMDAEPDTPSLDDLRRDHVPMPPRRIPSDDIWYLMLTSGTTGTPKAVIQTPRMAWANAVNIGQAVDMTSTDSSLNFLPLFHTAGINLYTLPIFLFGGHSTVFAKFDPDGILATLKSGTVNQFFGVPAIYQAFSLHADIDEVDWSAIRCGCGGAPLPEPLITFFAERGALICNGFGMTETGPTAFLVDRDSATDKIGSIGKAQMLTEVRIDGGDGTEDTSHSGDGPGELLLRGPAITPGYYRNPEATAAAFTEDGWLRSGDVARRDKDGYFFIVDRIKDMYISGGENVYPAEVERVLDNHPDILEAAVVGVADARWGEVGAAFLLARPDHTIDTGSLDAWCRERLAAYKVPKSFHVEDDLPRTAAGKVRKPDLRERLA